MLYREMMQAAERSGSLAASLSHLVDAKKVAELWDQLVTLQTRITYVLDKYRHNHTRYIGALPSKEAVYKTLKPVNDPIPCIGIDGSQIYPDHESPILLGWVTALAYEMNKGVILQRGKCLTEILWEIEDDLVLQKTIIDVARALIETVVLKEICTQEKNNKIILMDGSLLPWIPIAHTKDTFIEKSMNEFIDVFATCKPATIAAVSSNPRSRALINLIHLAEEKGSGEFETVKSGPRDRDLISFILNEGERTAVFMIGSVLNERFKQRGAGIYFFYTKVKDEIIRVEIPEWIAQDDNALDIVHSSLLSDSQALGIPYSLAQAHHHVIVKTELADVIRQKAETAYYQAGGKGYRISAKKRMKGYT